MVFFRLESAAANYLDNLCVPGSVSSPSATSDPSAAETTARAIRTEFIATELQRLCNVYLVRLHSLLLSAGAMNSCESSSSRSGKQRGDDLHTFRLSSHRKAAIEAFATFSRVVEQKSGSALAEWSLSERDEHLRLCVEILRGCAAEEEASAQVSPEGSSGTRSESGGAACLSSRFRFVDVLALARCCSHLLVGQPYIGATLSSPHDISCSRSNRWVLPSRDRELLAPFPNDADVLVPVAVISNFLLSLGLTLERHFVGAAAGEDAPLLSPARGEWGAFCICPAQSPINPHRREKDVRLAVVRHIAETHEYNAMIQREAPGRALGLAADGSTVRQLSIALGASTSAAELRTASQALGRLAPSDPRQQRESYATFIRDISFGFDMRLMSLAGSVVGYYVMYSRGSATDQCVIGAAVGAVIMLMVDAVMLLFRVGREDKTLPGHRGNRREDSNKGEWVPAASSATSSGGKLKTT